MASVSGTKRNRADHERGNRKGNGDHPTVTHTHEEVQELLRKLEEIYQKRGYFSLSAEGENTAQKARESEEAPTLSETYYEARAEVAAAGYGVSVEDIDNAWEKSLTDEEMTEADALAYEELVAKMIDLTLGTEENVRRMTRRSPKLAQQLLDRVSDTVDLFRGTNADRAQTKKLRRAELMLEDALDEIRERNEKAEKAARHYSTIRDDEEKARVRAEKNADRELAALRAEYQALSTDAEREEWLKAHPDVMDVKDLEDVEDYDYKNYSASDFYTNGKIYSYDFLTAQRDMPAVKLPETGALADQKGKIDDETVLSKGVKNAREEGVERNGKIYVKNVYTGRELRIDNSTIKHGLDGTYNRHLTNARIGSVIGTVVKNAIPINGLKNTSEKAVGTYAMAAYCYDSKQRQFIAIVTVEQHTGNVDSFELYDIAHAVSGRQKKGSQVDTKSPGVYPIEATTISIAQLLEFVNTTHKSILSNDVLAHFGEERPANGSYSDKVLFSLSNASDKVTVSKGAQRKIWANYNSDKVFSKKDVETALSGIDAFAHLPKEAQAEWVDSIWQGMNHQVGERRERYVGLIADKLTVDLLNKALSSEDVAKIKELRGKIAEAHRTLKGEELKNRRNALYKQISDIEREGVGGYFANENAESVEQIEAEARELVEGALQILEASGKISHREKLKQEFDTSRAGFWKAERDRAVETNKLLGNLRRTTQRIRDLKTEAFSASSAYEAHTFKGTVEKLANIEIKGNLSVTKTRTALKTIRDWYSFDNPFFYTVDEKHVKIPSNGYDATIAEYVNDLVQGDGAFTVEDLKKLDKVFSFFHNMADSYNKVYRNGKLVEAMPLARAYIENIHRVNRTRATLLAKYLAKDRSYMREFGDPAALFRCADQYDQHGFYTEVFEDLRRGAIGMAYTEMELMREYNDFLKKNKKYNLVVSVIPSKDNYVRNNLVKHGIKMEYQKEDLSQVNHQLYEWLATINDRSSNSSIPDVTEKINPKTKNNSEKVNLI